MPTPSSHASGKVYLVGAGPGDPELITVRGAEVLAQADVILFDYLANPRLLEHASPGAETICLGQHGQKARIWEQKEIHEYMIRAARQGRVVVRLKGGDPAIFGRGGEEAEALAQADVAFEIIPGVTAASAAMAYAGIPLTHRELASGVALITGQESQGQAATSLDFAALAAFPGTLVIYMGVTTAPQWVDRLLAAGKPGDTPAAIVRHCSLPDQTTRYCSLAEVPQRIADDRVRPPVLVIIGDVVRLGPRLAWFEKQPLFGRRIWVTRPAGQAEDLQRKLVRCGAHVLCQPAIEIQPPPSWSDVDAAIDRLHQFDWIVFSSANGVDYFLRRLRARGFDWRALGSCRLAVIGPGTAEQLAGYGLQSDLQPARYVAEALAEALLPHSRDKQLLLIRASRGREVLAEQLTGVAAEVCQVVAYASRDVTRLDTAIETLLQAGDIDWVTVTSSAIAVSLVRLCGDLLKNSKLVSISPVTSRTLRDQGLEPTAEAAEPTMDSLIAAILAHQP
jgi:uroporphyrinogen III methyltransferase / synthase